MPRKIKTPASVSQDRENQRRSRARRKDYVQDLETRVRQYENAGVQATVEMQRAARAVESENRALRTILAMYGLSPTDIDERVQGVGGGVAAAPPLEVRTATAGGGGAGNVIMTNDSRVPSSLASSQATSVVSPSVVSPTTAGSTPIEPQPSPPVSKCCPKASNSSCNNDNSNSKNSCATTTAPKRNSIVSTMEKPCHEAALILAELGSQADRVTIRRSLGCVGDEECFVKNTDLMRIIERGV